MKTVNKMKLLAEINDDKVNASVPTELKRLIQEQAKRDNMNVSQWMKLALIEKLERELINQE